jgi:hypothetical protein
MKVNKGAMIYYRGIAEEDNCYGVVVKETGFSGSKSHVTVTWLDDYLQTEERITTILSEDLDDGYMELIA